MLFSGHDMAIAFMNSLQLWLPVQDPYNIKSTKSVTIPTCSTNWTQWVIKLGGMKGGREQVCVPSQSGRGKWIKGSYNQDYCLYVWNCQRIN